MTIESHQVQQPAAIVLAGGQSSRMGTDKALLVVNGRSLVDHVVAVAHAAGITDVVVSGAGGVPDASDDQLGPMAGIVASWEHLQSSDAPPDPVVVLSCDLPALTSEVVATLIGESRTSEFGAVAFDGERLQPLIAAYRASALDKLTVAFDAGERSVRRCFEDWDLVTVPFDRAALTDADTPGDLSGFDVSWPDEAAPPC